jgi:hypothetical protein
VRKTGAAMVLVLFAGALAGCGDGAGVLSAPSRDALHANIDAVRTAVERDDDPAALTAVATLRASVRDLTARGDLDASDAKVLLTQVDRIAAELKSSSVVPTPTPTIPEPRDKAKAGGPKDKGKGPKK